jgi:hypothetical protein
LILQEKSRCWHYLQAFVLLTPHIFIGAGGMRKSGLIGLALAVPGSVAAVGAAQSGDVASPRLKAPIDCKATDAPYKNYDCLDAYLGDGFLERLINYYKLEWGHEAPPADPKAPSARRPGGRMPRRRRRHSHSPNGLTVELLPSA